MPIHDRATIDCVQRGDPAALADLYERFYEPLYQFAYWRLARKTEEVQEAVQETFLWALHHLGKWDDSRVDLEGWLFGILRNQIRTIYRRQRREETFELKWDRIDRTLAAALAHLSNADVPEDELQRAETKDLVHMVVAQLPVRFQDAIRRRYWNGQSHEEISTDLGVSVKAVESLLARAREAFRAALTTFVKEDFCVV
jgi:RNA polymerase sigma-70 factor (ECF subfamily)